MQRKKRVISQSVHHDRLIKYTKKLLTYLVNEKGNLWAEIDAAYPRGMDKTGFRAQLKKLNKQVHIPFKQS